MNNPDLMDKIVALCKRRGFIFPGSEIYGGLANSWDYGPLGVELKNNIKNLWWQRFVHQRDDIVGLDAALIMNPKVWEASGHLQEFSDPLMEYRKCHQRFRNDQVLLARHRALEAGSNLDNLSDEDKNLLICSKRDPVHLATHDFGPVVQFNLMFKTNLGPVADDKSVVYFRPETAQAMFVNFKNIVDTTRKPLPFGIAQIGKAFRNEITPGNFIFRTREFEQMEIEYFFNPKDDWQQQFEMWRKQMLDWMKTDLGLNLDHVHELEVPEGERAHYSQRTVDFEYDFPFGRKELYGLAYRGDFDLNNHQKVSGQSLEYTDPQTNEKYLPHVIEPTWGVDRSVLAVLCESYDDSDKDRVVLRLPKHLAPYQVAVFPLLKNKPELVAKAKEIYNHLRQQFTVAWDDRGNVGKRYYSQDEIGTPYGVTIDFETLENGTVTVRDRDTTKQDRIKVEELTGYLTQHLHE